MRKKVIGIIILLIIFIFNMQNIYAYNEIYKVNDDKNRYNSIAYTSDGGYVVVGYTSDRKSAYISVYNSDGKKINEKTYGYQFTYFNSVIQTRDNAFVAVGSNSRNYSDALIVKFDSNLNVIWENTYTGTKYERYSSVIETSDGNIVAVGTADQINGNTQPAKGLIVKYDKNGNQLWTNTIGGTSYDVFNSIVETSDNCYAVVGTFKSKDLENLEINGEADAIIFKYNSEGKLLWKKSYGGSSYDEFNSIIKTSDGGYIAVGSTTSKDIDDITDSEQWKCLIVKYDKDFNLLWNKGYGSGHQSEFLDVVELQNNDIIAVGETYSVAPIQHGILIEYDSKGNRILTKSSSPEDDVQYSSITCRDNNFIIIETNLTTNTSKVIKYSYAIENNEEIAIKNISLNKTELNITEGDSYNLIATITPSEATNKTLTWSSDDEKVAKVENGKVTAISEGTANITVTTRDGNHTATCKVTVTKKTVTPPTDNGKEETPKEETPKKDDTIAKDKLPQTGSSTFIITGAIILISVIGFITYKKVKYMNF